MKNANFLFVILLLSTGYVNCQTAGVSYQREVSSILILYSSQLDFGPTAAAELNRSILTGVNDGKLRLEFIDLNSSACSHHDGGDLIAVIKGVFYERTSEVVGIVGLSCSDSSYAVAKLIQRSGIPVKYIYTSFLPAPLAAEVSGTSVGLLPPVDLLADASVALIKYANWSEVLALYQQTDVDMHYLFLHYQSLWEAMNSHSLQIEDIILSHPWQVENMQLEKLLHKYSFHIVVLMVNAEFARSLLCSAFDLKIFYPTFQWVITKITLDDILSIAGGKCDKESILTVLKNALFVNFLSDIQGNDTESVVIYKLSIQAFVSTLNSANSHDPSLKLNTSGNSLHKSDSEFLSMYYFSKVAHIHQMVNNTLLPVLMYINTTSSIHNTTNNITLISGVYKLKLEVINLPTGLLLSTVNCLVLLSCVCLHLLTLHFRQEPSVKTSSTLLLHLCYIGSYAVNTMTTVYLIQKTIPITSDTIYVNVCIMYSYIINVGITLVLGTLTVKIWRLYRIFIHYMSPGKFLSDYMLVALICCLSLVDIVICTFWLTLSPLKRTYMEVSRDNIRKTITYSARCRSNTTVYANIILQSYHLLIFLVMMFMLLKLRNEIPRVHIKLHSHREYLYGYIIIVVIVCCIVSYALTQFVGVVVIFEVLSLGVLFTIIQISCIRLIFLPPLLPLLQTH